MEMLLIDTNIFIDHFRGVGKATEFLTENTDLIVPFVVLVEVFHGARNKGEQNLFIDFFKDFDIDYGDAEINKYAFHLFKKYRLSRNVEFNDSLIAAFCIKRGYTLVTKNHKHFNYINDLMIKEIDW